MVLERVADRGGDPAGGAGDGPHIVRFWDNRHRLVDGAFRERVRRLHALGPRPTGELLAEVLAVHPQLEPYALERFAHYAGLDPRLISGSGAADWLEPGDLIRSVAGGRS
jgi:hypothetical protein